MTIHARCLGVLLALAALAPAARAQDNHYWTQNYGTRSELLGGAVVGSLLDLSAVYYNPGALALMPDPSILVSAKAFEYQKIETEHREAHFGIEDATFSTAPSLFATQLPSPEGQVLAFTALTRQRFELRTESRVELRDELLPRPDFEFASGEVLIDHDLGEQWFGAAWSRAPGDRWSFGVSPFVAFRSQRTRLQAMVATRDSSGSVASSDFVDDFAYSHSRLLAKIGFAWDRSPMTMGLVITTPGLGIPFLSEGSAHFNRTVSGRDIDGDGEPDDLLATRTEEKLDATFKSPWSIAAGAAYRVTDTVVHGTLEWFGSVDPYKVLDTTGISEEGPGATLARRLQHEQRSIVNAGIGVEHFFRDHLQMYGSFTTDFASTPGDSKTNHALASWDIYHTTVGVAGTFHGLDLTGGVGYSSGGDERERDSDILEDPLIKSIPAKVSYRRLKFVVGFAFTF